MPHVGSAGDQGSHCVSSSDAQERGLPCRRASAGRPVSIPPRDRFNGETFWEFLKVFREVSAVPGRRVLAARGSSQSFSDGETISRHLNCAEWEWSVDVA